MNITFEIDTREVDALFSRADAHLEAGFPKAMKRIDAMIARSINLNFQQQGRPGKWQPLAEATIRARRRKAAQTGRQPVAGLTTPLRVTDRLRRSVTATAGANVPGQVSEVGPLSIIRGTSEKQARRIQEGYRGPARPFLAIQPQDKAEAVDLLGVGLREMVRDISTSSRRS